MASYKCPDLQKTKQFKRDPPPKKWKKDIHHVND